MFKLEDDKSYRMPAHFGGWILDRDAQVTYHDVFGLAFLYTTDGDLLANYIPQGFELTKPQVMLQFQECRQVDWMAGSYYNLLTVAAPVRFKGQRDELEGAFALVVWENDTTPILTGNMMGVPKIYADIEDLHICEGTYRTRLSYEGNAFLRLEMTDPQPMDQQQVEALAGDVNSLGWRYIPKVGGPGADLSQPILFPMRSEPHSAWMGRGAVQWTPLTWEQNPTQHHIIKALAELPIIEMSPVLMTRGRMHLMEARGRVLQ